MSFDLESAPESRGLALSAGPDASRRGSLSGRTACRPRFPNLGLDDFRSAGGVFTGLDTGVRRGKHRAFHEGWGFWKAGAGDVSIPMDAPGWVGAAGRVFRCDGERIRG